MRLTDVQWGTANAVYLLILIIPMLYLFWHQWKKRKSLLESLGNSNVLRSIALPSTPFSFWTKSVALILAWLFAVIALAQPKGNPHYPEALIGTKNQTNVLRYRAHDIIILIDASSSMNVSDMRTGQSRFEYAKDVADEIIRHMKGDNVILYAFTSQATLLVPETTDYLFARLMLQEMQINEGEIPGTDITHLLEKIHETYLSAPSSKRRTVILLSDGGDTAIESLLGEAQKEAIENLANILQDATKNSYRVLTIGLGTDKGGEVPNLKFQGKPVISVIQKELLQKVSETGRGRYYAANQSTPMEIALSLFQFLNSFDKTTETFEEHLSENEEMVRESLLYDLYYQVPLGLALLFLAYNIFYPYLRRKTVREVKDEKFAASH